VIAASAVVALRDLFGDEAVAAIGQGDGSRAHVVLVCLAWAVLRVDRGEPDAVVGAAVRTLVVEVHRVLDEQRRVAE
jgi:hypothetical protein